MNARLLSTLLLFATCLLLPAASSRPNILFIFSDDQRFDTLGGVNPLINTPHLDGLANSGVRFDRAYVTTSICSPSRAAVLSGRYGTRNGVSTLSDGLNFPDHTFAQYLRKAGYRTAQFGKWHLQTTPAEAGFDDYARINSNGSWFNRNIDSNIPGMAANLGGTFYEEFMAEAVIDYIGGHTASAPDKPFVLWWCNQVPHVDGAFQYPDVNGGQASYNVADMAVPANWADDPAGWGAAGTKPGYLATSRSITKSVDENYGGPGGYTNPASGVRNSTLGEDNVQQHLLEYYASVTALDVQIGRVLDRLDDPDGDGDNADSIVDNTWIVFMGDNGWQTGSHKFTSKVLAYEESARVPLIVKGPGVAPRVDDSLVLNIDLTPMFLGLAGVPAAAHHQGINLRALVDNPGAAGRSHLYYEAIIPEGSLGAEPHDAIRDDRYKLIRTYDDLNSTNVVYEELYDLQVDPGELTNQAGNPAFAAIKGGLETALTAEKAAVAASADPPAASAPSGNLLGNPSFDTGDKSSWSVKGGDSSTVVAVPLDGGSHALQFNSGSATSWVEQAGLDLSAFTAKWLFRFDGPITSRAMNVHLRSNNAARLNLRINAAGAIQFYNGTDWTTPSAITGSNSFEQGATYEFTVTGAGWGDTASTDPAAGTYEISWIDLVDGSSDGSYSSVGQSNNGYAFAMPNTLETGELDGIRFLDDFGDNADPDFRIDAVSIETTAGAPGLEIDPAGSHLDYQFGPVGPGTQSRTVSFLNSHPSNPVTITEVCLLSDGAGTYSLGAISPAIPALLGPGQAFSVEVSATAASGGIYGGEILVATSDPFQNIILPLDLEVAGTSLLANGGFEEAPFDSGWTSSGVITEAGLNGSAIAARLGFGATATLGQVAGPLTDFTFDVYVQIAGATTSQSFRILVDGDGGTAIEVRGALGNVIQLNSGGLYGDVTRISDDANFPVPANIPIRIRLIGRDFGTPAARYDLLWSDPGSAVLAHAATGITSFVTESAATSGAGLTGIRFDRNDPSAHSYWVDDVSLENSAAAPLPADYEFLPPFPPPLPKVVKISGVYPHLAMTNNHNEVGPGAIAPQAGKLWIVTYGPHLPNGDSTNKLYEIDPTLHIMARPESVGGTPANRMYHPESDQLFIGHHAIAGDGTVRTIPVTSMPGRMTGIARHLTDPANKVYQATMEEGLYEVDVNTLAVTALYADTNGSTAGFGAPNAGLPGVHGKGLYSAQGRLVYSNNGNGGGLTEWDGTSWSTVLAEKFTEVTGPGGIAGNPPGDDRLWAVGWDDGSLLLYLLEAGAWHSYRLPKSSYTHDGDPGWFTEWPRIRQLDPSDPASPYLMHMHGMFFDFPRTFSTADISGLAPISSYHKMPVDYCLFDGQLVMTKNDTSKFSNTLAPKAQSNLWWGQFSELSQWGAPQGHGGVWLNQPVAANEISSPFLVNGFSRITLHLRNGGASSVPVDIETSPGDGTWTTLRTVTTPASGSAHDLLNGLSAEWIRLKATAATSDLTAYLLLSNPYPHAPIASLGTDEFAGLADIRDTGNHSDGVIRVMPGTDLKLEFASARADGGAAGSPHRYHQVEADLALDDLPHATLESDLRADAAIPQDFGSDAASAWIDDGGTRLRLPKLDPLYDAPFASGWARGFRETVTEREMLNCHGTFYEIPRGNSGGLRRMRPLATHGKRITDYATWRGLLVLTGVLDSAPESDALIKNGDGTAALWLGEVDDIWRMGEPRGVGGPWSDAAVTAGTPSDAYLMYGYDRKELRLGHSHGSAVTFTVEIDFLGDNSWSVYDTFSVASGDTDTHLFPEGFHAHWVRVTSDTTTTATAQFTYGPADRRDVLLDWARERGLPTGAGRNAVASANGDGDELSDLAEFVFGTDPLAANRWPQEWHGVGAIYPIRDLAPEDNITVAFESGIDLVNWISRPDLVVPDEDQSGLPPGFTRWRFLFSPATEPERFVRVKISG